MKIQLNLLITAFLYFVLVQSSWAEKEAQGFSVISLKAIEVTEGIHMLQGVGGFAGGNIAVSVGEDGVLMVDDQLAPMNVKIKQKLKELSGSKLKFVLNTHWHGDHTGGNAMLSDQATIIAHSNVRKRMSSDQSGFFGKTPASPKQAWPVITFDESMSIHFNDEEIKLMHYSNGHTDGDGVVYFSNSNVVHMGDLLFAGRFPFVDLASGGNVFRYAENLQKIMQWLPKDAKVIPGHGDLTDIEGIRASHAMLLETSGYVVDKANSGMSLEEIQQQGLPEKWKSWAWAFIDEKAWISFIYNSMPK